MAHDRPAPASPTSLDDVRTKFAGHDPGGDALAERAAGRAALSDDAAGARAARKRARIVEDTFRHSHWRAERSKVSKALRAASATASRIDRFNQCGRECWVQVHGGTGETRLVAQYCGDRFCKPCAATRAREVRRNLTALCEGQDVRFCTLTRRADDADLATALRDLRASFTRLRSSELWKSCVKGGAACVEIKRGAGSSKWHVHLHCLLVGRYIPQDALSEQWRESSGGSYVVDVRAVKDKEKGIWYVSKYATKGVDTATVCDPGDGPEVVHCLRGARLLSTFGEWWGTDVEAERSDPTGWRVVGRLHHVFAASLRGETWARAVFLRLGMVAGGSPETPVFLRPQDDD